MLDTPKAHKTWFVWVSATVKSSGFDHFLDEHAIIHQYSLSLTSINYPQPVLTIFNQYSLSWTSINDHFPHHFMAFFRRLQDFQAEHERLLELQKMPQQLGDLLDLLDLENAGHGNDGINI